jgi:formylglycine-generating enzyme required for sulfatase activity
MPRGCRRLRPSPLGCCRRRSGNTPPGRNDGRFAGADSDADLCAAGNGADQAASAAKLPAAWEFLRCNDGYAHTAPVASFKPNAFGLYDMMGNTWEWVEDCYVDNLADVPADGQARTSGDCSQRAVRGGAWSAAARMLRVALRAKAPRHTLRRRRLPRRPQLTFTP